MKDPVTLVQIRNTWAPFEWDGEWSDNSPLWTDDVVKKVGFVPAKEEGLFWMNLDDFVNEFTRFSFKRMQDQLKYSIRDCGHEKGNFSVERLKIEESGPVSLILGQNAS